MGQHTAGEPEAAPQVLLVSQIQGEGDTDDALDLEASKKKPLAFHLSFLALAIMVFVVSLDATTLAVAIPVAFPLPEVASLEM